MAQHFKALASGWKSTFKRQNTPLSRKDWPSEFKVAAECSATSAMFCLWSAEQKASGKVSEMRNLQTASGRLVASRAVGDFIWRQYKKVKDSPEVNPPLLPVHSCAKDGTVRTKDRPIHEALAAIVEKWDDAAKENNCPVALFDMTDRSIESLVLTSAHRNRTVRFREELSIRSPFSRFPKASDNREEGTSESMWWEVKASKHFTAKNHYKVEMRSEESTVSTHSGGRPAATASASSSSLTLAASASTLEPGAESGEASTMTLVESSVFAPDLPRNALSPSSPTLAAGFSPSFAARPHMFNSSTNGLFAPSVLDEPMTQEADAHGNSDVVALPLRQEQSSASPLSATARRPKRRRSPLSTASGGHSGSDESGSDGSGSQDEADVHELARGQVSKRVKKNNLGPEQGTAGLWKGVMSKVFGR